MRVLAGCEWSGVVRAAFRAAGYDAWSCDLEAAADGSPYHFRGDVRDVLAAEPFDLLIAFPPCTRLAVSGAQYFKHYEQEQREALALVDTLLGAPVDRIALENPIGIISTRRRRPDQIVQPYQFGHDASKATCLWLKGLPRLTPTKYVPPRMVNGRPRWANQTDSGQNRLPPSADRAQRRGRTYEGLAAAMAGQWGARCQVQWGLT